MITRTKEAWIEAINEMPVEGPGIRGDAFLYSAQKDWDIYKKYISPSDEDTILDVGCGHGRMAFNFINTKIKYEGLDILPNMLKWASSTFAPWDNIKFFHLPFYNSMYSTPLGDITKFGKQLDANPLFVNIITQPNTVKGILALSLFTHLETLDVVERYLMEFRRVIRNDGTLVATFFTSPPNDCSNDAKRTVFNIVDLCEVLVKVGFFISDRWGGLTRNWHDQTIFILKPL